MNIKGLERLMHLGLPVPRSTILFRTIQEIPSDYLKDDEPRWFMAGFDYKSCKLTDNPYKITKIRKFGFSRKELRKTFEQLESRLRSIGTLPEDRLYVLWELHTNANVSFSGFGFKSPYEIMIGFFNGNRPQGRELTPDCSVQILLVGEKPQFQYALSLCRDFRGYAIKIAKDLTILSDNHSVDFTCRNDGYLFYHDLWQIANHK